jgi:hypothetical protein
LAHIFYLFIVIFIGGKFCYCSGRFIGSSQKKTKGPYFYEGLNYGSQGNFNPASVLLNRGFEMLLIVLILWIRIGI